VPSLLRHGRARDGDVANGRLTGNEFLNAIAWPTGARIKTLLLKPEK
jgi:hypothetical protein